MALRLACFALAILTFTAGFAHAQSRAVWRGVDVSMLLELERAGATYYSSKDAGAPADAIEILRDAGCEWFRLRLFVDPANDYGKNWGATQDLTQVRALAKRVKAVGGKILLDLHYSDTWADGIHQAKPREWADLDFEALRQRVYQYTKSVLMQLKEDGTLPDAVQIGNEIAGGVLFPDGKLSTKGPEEARQWSRFAALLNAGSRAVREMGSADHSIGVMIHIHGGGQREVPGWFFSRLLKEGVDFDVIGLSVYPTWGDSLATLSENLKALRALTDKPVVIAETAYPAKPIGTTPHDDMLEWPTTETGQAQFLTDLLSTLRSSDQATGVIWWYGEARPVGNLWVWRDGAEGLFDEKGLPRPAMRVLGENR